MTDCVPSKEPLEKTQITSATARFADAAVLREIEEESRNYPSLDPKVQQDITRKYQILHERVKDAGLYECPYIEYGKEMMRYTSLFVGFLTALHYSWYITSAICLGLFWVCSSLPVPLAIRDVTVH